MSVVKHSGEVSSVYARTASSGVGWNTRESYG
jgi:hypothetical protein